MGIDYVYGLVLNSTPFIDLLIHYIKEELWYLHLLLVSVKNVINEYTCFGLRYSIQIQIIISSTKSMIDSKYENMVNLEKTGCSNVKHSLPQTLRLWVRIIKRVYEKIKKY